MFNFILSSSLIFCSSLFLMLSYHSVGDMSILF
nr:MAG TPA: hypothetical protein [Caudoviricetes sp.]